jgi:hypothetical protein
MAWELTGPPRIWSGSWPSAASRCCARRSCSPGAGRRARTCCRRRSGGHLTLWVNPATYLPVRLKLGGLQTDFQWLSPTPAGLALLNMPVPAGFHQVPPPS